MAVDEAHLLNITVLPERQRCGLGGELLGYLFDVARSHGAVRMLLEVRPGNDAALALYRRFGFGEIGRRRGYYQGSEDAIVMAREL
jgi:[ribosomal protein S18]-alanine N-acetyltransferase